MICNKLTERGSLCSYLLTVIVSVYVIIDLYIKAMICNKLTERGSLCSYLLTVIIVVYMS